MAFKHLLLRTLTGPALVMAFLVGIIATMMVGLQQNLGHAEDSLRSAMNVVVFLQSSVSDTDAKIWADGLLKQDAALQSTTLVTKEEAYKMAADDPSLSKSLILLKDNPLPASVVLRYKDNAWLERPDPTVSLKGGPLVQEVRWDPRAQDLFRTLHRWRMWCLRFSAFVGMVVLVWTLMGIYRFLSLRLTGTDLLINLGLGVAGGAVAIGLWEYGVRTVVMLPPASQPVWVAFLPILFGAAAAIGCFGVEARREN